MRLVRYLRRGQPRLGVWVADWVVDLPRLYAAWRRTQPAAGPPARLPATMEGLLRLGLEPVQPAVVWAAERLDAWVADPVWRAWLAPAPGHPGQRRAPARLLAPLNHPGKLVCVGLNYPHPLTPAPAPPYPVLFHKVAAAITGPGASIYLPPGETGLEYEVELGVVIGRGGRRLPLGHALDAVAGYVLANDVGAPTLQARTSQWTSGKMLDSFCPLGPALVTADEIPDPQALRLQTWINGDPVQDGSSAEMHCSVAELVSYISSLTTLEPGDLILTGSTKRCGAQPDPRRRMLPGDVVRIAITGLGELENPVVSEEV
jgi:5-carboxymethyl-2-hydroxymuconate isomerase